MSEGFEYDFSESRVRETPLQQLPKDFERDPRLVLFSKGQLEMAPVLRNGLAPKTFGPTFAEQVKAALSMNSHLQAQVEGDLNSAAICHWPR